MEELRDIRPFAAKRVNYVRLWEDCCQLTGYWQHEEDEIFEGDKKPDASAVG